MKTLVAWDDPQEAELLGLYLTLGSNEARFCPTPSELFKAAAAERWDVVLLAQTFPATADEGYAVFQKVQELLPGAPVVLGCRLDEMIGLPRFLTTGLRSYVVRDDRGDFIFLLLANLESTLAAVQAERSRHLSERLREEMAGVRRLQETIIPHDLRVQPGYRAVARYEPSEVSVAGDRPVVLAGGDYYNVFPIDDTALVALVGDASGHGLKACMSIITMHTLIRMMAGDRYRDTAGFVGDINRKLCDNAIVQDGGGFITMFYAALDTAAHRLSWTSAGHPLALVHDRRADEVRPVGTAADGGLPLGINGDAEYATGTVELPPGARVLIFSDGLTDALAPAGGAGAQFGLAGITAALRECRDRPLADTLDALFATSRAFTQGVGRHDDTSVVLIEREGE
jgi:phosphoserine phosphatase RsbU/P